MKYNSPNSSPKQIWTLPLYIEVQPQNQQTERSCICVIALSAMFLLDFGTVPTSVVFYVLDYVMVENIVNHNTKHFKLMDM